ncbi:hypothetical protein PanWU01x14_243130 [Parasponia andersonii]|uniref:Uncharacterized protein n=1 Tax=Parasponia andersonii TaxID=3476 RepID=A0A2P5BFI4_PARAD|nr:hypothetical protein PanWU01x14_243130 [Parasponia andersonii]
MVLDEAAMIEYRQVQDVLRKCDVISSKVTSRGSDGNISGSKFNIIRHRCAFVSNFGVNGDDLVCLGEKDENEGGFANITSRKNIVEESNIAAEESNIAAEESINICD